MTGTAPKTKGGTERPQRRGEDDRGQEATRRAGERGGEILSRKTGRTYKGGGCTTFGSSKKNPDEEEEKRRGGG